MPSAATAGRWRSTHIVSLELGGSNDIANLFPEMANAQPGYKVKDRLENKLHDIRAARSQQMLQSVNAN